MQVPAIALLLWLAAASPVRQDVLKSPAVGEEGEKGRTVTKSKTGAARSKAEWTMRRERLDGRPAVKMTESGRGFYSGFEQEVQWEIDAWWSAGDAFRPLRFEKVVTDSTGKALMRERKQFDWMKNEVQFERQDLVKNKNTTKTLSTPADTLAVEGIAGALRSLPFGPDMRFPAHFLTNEPKLYNMTLEERGREMVRTAAGTFECYKIEVVPHVGALGAFRFLFPKAYFWFTVDAPHSWVRYQGPENGPGTVEIVLERVE
jgi:hypothetical protein